MTTPIKNESDAPTGSKRWIPLSVIGLACIAAVSIYRFGFFHPAPAPEDPLRSGHQEVVNEVYKAKTEKMAPKERAEFATKSLEDSSPVLRVYPAFTTPSSCCNPSRRHCRHDDTRDGGGQSWNGHTPANRGVRSGSVNEGRSPSPRGRGRAGRGRAHPLQPGQGAL